MNPQVVFVVGTARSGSSILAAVLDKYRGWFASGELGYLWQRGLNPEKHCACGEVVLECPVWQPVLRDGITAGQDLAVRDYRRENTRFWGRPTGEVLDLQRHLDSPQFSWRLFRGSALKGWAPLTEYAQVLDGVYESVARATGAEVIVDTSKHVGEAAALHPAAGGHTDALLVHLVRDPRAVVHSALRRPYGQRPTRQGSRAAARVAASWVRINTEARTLFLSWPEDRRLQVRYEDFAANPGEVTAEIYRAARGVLPQEVVLDGHTAGNLESHIVSGGSARKRRRDVVIRLDTAWSEGLTEGEKRTVMAVASPIARRYGYSRRVN